MSFIIIIIFFYLAFNLNLIREEIEIAFKIFYSDTRWTRFLSPREIAKEEGETTEENLRIFREVRERYHGIKSASICGNPDCGGIPAPGDCGAD